MKLRLPKILHITKKYPDALGGDAVTVSHLEREQIRHGHKVAVLTSNCDEIHTGKHHHKFGLHDTPAALDRITPRRLISLAMLFFKSYRVIRQEKPDLIHTHSVDMAFAASFAARRYRVPIVHTFHILTFPDAHHSWLRRKTELLFLKGARPNVVTAPNVSDVQQLQNAGVANAAVLQNGIDLDFWQKRRSRKHETFTFIAAARLEEQKGIADLIDAAALLKRKIRKPFKVVIAGDGSLRGQLEEQARKKRVGGNIEFAGQKTPEELRNLYAASDAAVVPSLYESGPLTAFEAWAMKLPLIITPVGMFQNEPTDSERVLHAKIADHKSLAAAMQTVLEDDKKRRALAKAGFAAVQAHSWQQMRKNADELYQRAVKGKGAANSGAKPSRNLQFSERTALATLTVASLVMLCAAPLVSSIVNLFVTLPLLVGVPGLLLVGRFWPEQRKKPSLMVALSAAIGLLVIALESLALNWLLPALHITGEPLQLRYLVPVHAAMTALLFMLCYKRKPSGKMLTLRFDARQALRASAPLLLPLLAAAGAFRQNNGAGNTVTLIAFGAMAAMALWFVWKPKLWHAGWMIFNLALGLLLSTSLRSWFVSGFDISQEFQVFTAVLQAHHWNMHALPGNPYNACLSLTTLPAALQQFTHISPEFIFKFCYQAAFALTAALTYLIARLFISRRLSFLAALLYMAQTQFIGTMPAIARQEIGLLFFALLMYFLLEKNVLTRARKALLIVLGTGMVLMHYSTTYVTIMILGATAIVLFAAKRLGGRLPWLPKLKSALSIATLAKLAVLLMLLAGIWYGQINGSSANIFRTLGSALHTQLSLDTTSNKTQLLLGVNPDEANPKNVARYAAAQKLEVPIKPANVLQLPVKNSALAGLANLGRDVVALVIKVLLPLSPIMLLIYKKTRKSAADISFAGLGAVAIFMATIIIPAFSAAYNLQRVYQQCLIILGATSLWALWMLLPAGKRLKTAAVAGFVLAYLLLSPGSGLINQFAGGMAPRLNMNSYGEEYDKYYVRDSEVLSAEWLAQNCQNQGIWADRYATLRVTAYAHVPYDSIRSNIFNAKEGCLYLDYANVHDNLFYATYKKLPVRYTTPASSFKNYNLLYDNGESKVYSY